jgi:hypothetical protein
MLRNPRNTAYSNAPWRRTPRRPTRKFGKNGKHQRILISPGLSPSSGRLLLSATKTPQDNSPTTLADSLTWINLWTYSRASYSTISGLRGVKDTSKTNTPHKKFSLRPGWPLLRSVWPHGRPLDPTGPPRIPAFKLELSQTSERNGFIWTFSGRTMPPSGGISFLLYTFKIYLMIDGVVASLPVRGSPCICPWDLHPNGFLSQDSQGGVPKLSQFGL